MCKLRMSIMLKYQLYHIKFKVYNTLIVNNWIFHIVLSDSNNHGVSIFVVLSIAPIGQWLEHLLCRHLYRVMYVFGRKRHDTLNMYLV